jgi:hypothetical protein
MKGIIQEAIQKAKRKKHGLRIVQRYLSIKYKLNISLRALKKRTK